MPAIPSGSMLANFHLKLKISDKNTLHINEHFMTYMVQTLI
jgi:hypothetical protein